MPNQTMATGIQAIGLIGRSIWITGLTTGACGGIPAEQQSHRNAQRRPQSDSPTHTRRSESPI